MLVSTGILEQAWASPTLWAYISTFCINHKALAETKNSGRILNKTSWKLATIFIITKKSAFFPGLWHGHVCVLQVMLLSNYKHILHTAHCHGCSIFSSFIISWSWYCDVVMPLILLYLGICTKRVTVVVPCIRLLPRKLLDTSFVCPKLDLTGFLLRIIMF